MATTLGTRLRRLREAKGMTLQQVADALMEGIDARGVIVVTECDHMCMAMRGVKKAQSRTVTSAVRGCMRDAATRR